VVPRLILASVLFYGLSGDLQLEPRQLSIHPLSRWRNADIKAFSFNIWEQPTGDGRVRDLGWTDVHIDPASLRSETRNTFQDIEADIFKSARLAYVSASLFIVCKAIRPNDRLLQPVDSVTSRCIPRDEIVAHLSEIFTGASHEKPLVLLVYDTRKTLEVLQKYSVDTRGWGTELYTLF
jgi:hypothetical protein